MMNEKNFPPVASKEKIKSVCEEVSSFRGKSMDYYVNLKNFHDSFTKIESEQKSESPNEIEDMRLSNCTKISEIEKYLMNSEIKNDKNISDASIRNQIDMVSGKNGKNLGLRLLLATYVKSVALIGDFLCNPPKDSEPSTNKKCAQQAIKMLLNTTLPPLFYPILEKEPKIALDVSEFEPILPTAVAMSDTTLFIGLRGPRLAMVPLQKTDEDIKVIKVEGFSENEPFSVIYDNNFLTLSCKSMPTFHMDLETMSFVVNLPLFYRTNLFYLKKKRNPFEPPIVSDGLKYYSIEFGPKPNVKVFQKAMDSILFEGAISLKCGSQPLSENFPELLPLAFKDTAAIATNGVYISFILNDGNFSICRIFYLYTGEHLHDVILDPKEPIKSWVFNTNRPAHFVLHNNKFEMLSGCFTLPLWLTGYEIPDTPPTIKTNNNQNVISGYCNALSIVASKLIGVEAATGLRLIKESCGIQTEKALLNFIDNKNMPAASAFLVFLAIKMSKKESVMVEVTELLERFEHCFNDDEYKCLRTLIVHVLLSSFDSFCQVDSNMMTKLLLQIIKNPTYKTILFKWLPKSRLLTRVLNEELLLELCKMALKTHHMLDDMALPLLKELQYGFVKDMQQNITELEDLFSIYVTQLYNQFSADYELYKGGKCGLEFFGISVSFLVFDELVKIVSAKANTINCSRDMVEILIKVGNLDLLNGNPLAINSFYTGLTLAFNMIRKDMSFICFGDRPKSTGDIKEFEEELNIKNSVVPKNLLDSLIRCTFNSCRANVSMQKIRDSINNILYMYTKGELEEELLMMRLEEADKLNPQLVEVVFDFIKTGKKVIVKTPEESVLVWFINILNNNINYNNEEIRVLCAIFIPQLYEVWHHFAVLPVNFINTLVHNCPLRFYTPIEILEKITIPLSIENIDNDELNAVFPSLLQLCDKFINMKCFINNVKGVKKTTIFDKKERKELLSIVQKLRIAVEATKSIESAKEEILEFSKELLFIGDLEILKYMFDSYVSLFNNSFTDTRFVEYCIETIENFLTFKKFMITDQETKFQTFQAVFATVDFIRRLVSDKIEPVIQVLVEMAANHPTTFFAICNERYEIPRPGVNVSVTVSKNDFYGKVKEFDGVNDFVIETEKEEVVLDKKYINRTIAKPTVDFCPSNLSEHFEEIAKVFETFGEEEEVFLQTFFYASLADFCRNSSFISVIDKNLFEKAIKRINQEFICSRDVTTELLLTFNRYDENDILFSFNKAALKEKKESTMSSLAIKESTKIKEKKTKVNNTIFSFTLENQYISSQIPTTYHSVLNIKSVCTEHQVDQFSLSIYLVCPTEGLRFKTEPISLENEVKIEINPTNKTICIDNNDKHYKYAIQPSATSLFFKVKLIPRVVISYTFETFRNIEKSLESSEADFISFTKDSFDVHPFQNSYLVTESLVKKLSLNLCSRFAMEAVENFISNSVSNEYSMKDLAYIAMSSLSFHDSDTKSKEIVFRDNIILQKIMQLVSEEGNEEFINEVIKIIEEEVQKMSMNYFISFDNSSASVLNEGTEFAGNGVVLDKTFIPNDNISGTYPKLCIDVRHAIAILSGKSKNFRMFIDRLTHIKGLSEVIYRENSDLFDVFLVPEHETLTKSDEWYQNTFPNLFNNNKVFADIVDAQFFLLRGSELCFPIHSFIPRLLYSTSFVSCIMSMNQKMISFQNFPSSDNEYIFLYIGNQANEDSKGVKNTEFDISSDPGFTNITCSLKMNDFAFLQPYSFFLRPQSPRFDMKRAQFFWKTFTLSEEDILHNIKENIFNWKPLYSHIILATLDTHEPTQLTQEVYEGMPLSARFSYDVVSFITFTLLSSINSPFANLVSEQNIEKPSGILNVEERITRFKEIFNDIDPFAVNQNDSHVLIAASAAIYAYSGKYAKFTIPEDIIKNICTGDNNEGSIFRHILGLDKNVRFEEIALKLNIYGMNTTVEEFISVVDWHCSEENKENVVNFIEGLKPFIISLILAASTGHYSIESLENSSNKFLCIVETEENHISFIKDSSTIAIPRESTNVLITKEFMELLMSLID